MEERAKEGSLQAILKRKKKRRPEGRRFHLNLIRENPRESVAKKF
jgi:hypothetical protein